MVAKSRVVFKKILESQAKALGFTYRESYEDYRLKQVQYDFAFGLDAFDHVRAHVFDRKGKAVGIQIHIRDFNASKTIEILKQTIQRL